jgi:opacity protein-like surface antigen
MLSHNLRLCLSAVFVLFSAVVFSQSNTKKINRVSLEAGNAITAYPITGFPQLFYSNFHPYVTVGAGLVWKEKRKHAWEQTFNLGYMYHRFVQHSIPLFMETVYRLKTGKNFSLGAHLGLGYLHSVPATDRFELNADGEYEKITNLGRAQGMAKISFSGAYQINRDFRLTLNYGMLFQSPFVKSYVPVLPYNTLQLGVQKSLNNR